MISARRKWPSESYPLRLPPPRKTKSRKRSSPPVSRRLVSSSERLPANGLAELPSVCTLPSSGWVEAIAGPEVRAVRPRLVKNAVELFANAGRLVKALLIPGAATARSVNTGVVWSANLPKRSAAGPSWRRNAGKSARFWASAPRCSAVARATVLLDTMKLATRSRTAANGASALVGVDREFRERLVLAARRSRAPCRVRAAPGRRV